jgi:hypothetical protein
MKLWLISQDVNNNYDTYDSAVVAAETADEAQRTHPGGEWHDQFPVWASKPEDVKVQYLGEASAEIKAGVILGSFNAG